MFLRDRKFFMTDTAWLVVVSPRQTAACDLLMHVIIVVSAVELVAPVVVAVIEFVMQTLVRDDCTRFHFYH